MAFDPFSIFTGDPQIEAAGQQRANIQQSLAGIGQTLAGGQAGGLAALQSGQAGAIGAITPAIAQARGDIAAGQAGGLASLQSAQDMAAQAIRNGMDPAIAAIQFGVSQAGGAYDPLAAAAGRYGAYGQQASQASADALGLNGPEGVARAQQTFTAGPGYQFQLGQGLESIARNANAAGMVASGNQLRESQTYGSGLAAQEFDKYRNLLAQREGLYAPLERGALSDVAAGRAGAGLTGATSLANIYTGTAGRLSDLYSGTGARAADIYGTGGRSLADISTTGGQNLANIYTRGGQDQAQLIADTARQSAAAQGAAVAPTNATYQQEAAAVTGGAKNAWNLGMDLAKLAAGIPSFGGGGGSATGMFGATSGNYASPYYSYNYGTPSQLFPGYAG